MATPLPVIDEGEGDAIVFLHGFTLDHRMWRDQREALRAQFRVVLVDLPGHGAAAQDGAASPAHEVLRVLDDRGIARATLVGSSLGGTVALDLALDQPARVRSLVLLDAILLAPAAGPPPEQVALAALAQAGDLAAARARWLLRDPFTATRSVPAARVRLEEMIADYRGAHWLARVRDLWLHAPHTEYLPRLDVPALVWAGVRGGPRGVAMAEQLAALLPAGRLALGEDVGHLLSIEAPERLTTLIRGFVSELA